jgi:hypothetical protein
MKRSGCVLFAAVCALLVCGFACGAPQIQGVPADSVKTCIQGKVWMKSAIDSKQIPYAGATVNVWRHDKDLALVETKTDSDGNYCIEVPVGDFRVDLRVWGMERMDGTSYICKGSVQNIDPGKTQKKCGEDCFKADILTQCEERMDRRIGSISY